MHMAVTAKRPQWWLLECLSFPQSSEEPPKSKLIHGAPLLGMLGRRQALSRPSEGRKTAHLPPGQPLESCLSRQCVLTVIPLGFGQHACPFVSSMYTAPRESKKESWLFWGLGTKGWGVSLKSFPGPTPSPDPAEQALVIGKSFPFLLPRKDSEGVVSYTMHSAMGMELKPAQRLQ